MTKHTKRVLISGANGFVGTAVVNRLFSDTSWAVTALVRDVGHSLPKPVRTVKGDLFEPKTIEKAVLSTDVYVHLASEIDINGSLAEPRVRLDRATAMLLNVLELLRTHNKKTLVVFTSTDRVYGATTKKIVNEAERPTPIEPYTASKILCETILETYSRLYDIPFIILRLSSIYGPRQPRSMFISDVIQKMADSSHIEVGNLKTYKNFVFVDDVAYAVERAIASETKSQNAAYNIGGQSVSMEQVLKKIKAHMEVHKGEAIKVKKRQDNRPTKIEVNQFRLSTKKALTGLGWSPQVSFDAGLKKTINYFLEL